MGKHEFGKTNTPFSAYGRGREDAIKRRYTPIMEKEQNRDEYNRGYLEKIMEARTMGGIGKSDVPSSAYERGQEDAIRRRYTPTMEKEKNREEYTRGFSDKVVEERKRGSG